MKTFINLFVVFTISINISADDHADEMKSFPGLISSETFDMSNGMVMHVERRKTCNQLNPPLRVRV